MTFNLNKEETGFKPHLPIVMGKNGVFLALLCSSAVMLPKTDTFDAPEKNTKKQA